VATVATIASACTMNAAGSKAETTNGLISSAPPHHQHETQNEHDHITEIRVQAARLKDLQPVSTRSTVSVSGPYTYRSNVGSIST